MGTEELVKALNAETIFDATRLAVRVYTPGGEETYLGFEVNPHGTLSVYLETVTYEDGPDHPVTFEELVGEAGPRSVALLGTWLAYKSGDCVYDPIALGC